MLQVLFMWLLNISVILGVSHFYKTYFSIDFYIRTFTSSTRSLLWPENKLFLSHRLLILSSVNNITLAMEKKKRGIIANLFFTNCNLERKERNRFKLRHYCSVHSIVSSFITSIHKITSSRNWKVTQLSSIESAIFLRVMSPRSS